MRLVHPVQSTSPSSGRVEVCYEGSWGTVCGDDWDLSDGAVVCRQLGFPDVQAVYRNSFYGPGNGSILMDNVQCTGAESRLQDCSFKGWTLNDCSHQDDAGVQCRG